MSVSSDANYQGQPPIGTPFTGMVPGDIFVAKVRGQWHAYLAQATGLPDGSVTLIDVHDFAPNNIPKALAGLSDVTLATLTDGDVLTYEASSGKWKNKPDTDTGGADFFSMPYRGYVYAADNALAALGDVPTTFGSIYGVPSSPLANLGPVVYLVPVNTNIPGGFYGRPIYRIGRNPKFLVEAALDTTTHPLVWMGWSANPISVLTKSGALATHANSALFAGFRFFNGTDFWSNAVGADATWQACIYVPGAAGALGSTGVIIDTTVVPDTSTHKFAVVFDDANGRALFYINGSLVANVDLTGVTIGSSDKDLGLTCSTAFLSSAGSVSSPNLLFSQAQMQADF